MIVRRRPPLAVPAILPGLGAYVANRLARHSLLPRIHKRQYNGYNHKDTKTLRKQAFGLLGVFVSSW
jgi:hypothetical protein